MLNRIKRIGTAGIMVVSGALLCFTPQLDRSAGSAPVYLQVSFLDGAHGVLTAEKGAHFWFQSTSNGGQSWTSHRLPFNLLVPGAGGESETFGSSLSFISLRTGWVAGYLGKGCPQVMGSSKGPCKPAVYRTTNGGAQWKQVLSLPQATVVDEVDAVSKTLLWVVSSRCHDGDSQLPECGYHQKLRVSRNGGDSWSTISFRFDLPITQLTWNSKSDGWLATGSPPGASKCASALYHTVNGGSSWKRAQNLTGECDLAYSFAGKAGWATAATRSACTSGGCPETLLESSDGGSHWKINQDGASIGSNGFLRQTSIADANHGFLTFSLGGNLNTEGGILTTSDSGKTWTRSYPCYSVGPGGASAPNTSTLWVTGMWASYCDSPHGTGLFESSDWGSQWKQVSTGL